MNFWGENKRVYLLEKSSPLQLKTLVSGYNAFKDTLLRGDLGRVSNDESAKFSTTTLIASYVNVLAVLLCMLVCSVFLVWLFSSEKSVTANHYRWQIRYRPDFSSDLQTGVPNAEIN